MNPNLQDNGGMSSKGAIMKDLAAALVCAVLIGGPFAVYFAFVMTP